MGEPLQRLRRERRIALACFCLFLVVAATVQIIRHAFPVSADVSQPARPPMVTEPRR